MAAPFAQQPQGRGGSGTQGTKAFSRDKARVLLRLDASKMPPNAEYHGTNGDMPLVWAKTYVYAAVAAALGSRAT